MICYRSLGTRYARWRSRQRKREGMSAENFALVRKFPLNLLKRDRGKGSLVTKRRKAVCRTNSLFALLEI